MKLEKIFITYRENEKSDVWKKAVIVGGWKKIPYETLCPCGCDKFVLVDKCRSYFIKDEKWWESEEHERS
jgi:hypothetical protein